MMRKHLVLLPALLATLSGFSQVSGCTDPNAPNYNPQATVDDGTCCSANWYGVSADVPVFWSFSQLVNSGFFETHYGWSDQDAGSCLNAGCYSFAIYPITSSTTGFSYSVTDGSGNVLWSADVTADYDFHLFSTSGPPPGCPDPNACNYAPNAGCDLLVLCDYVECSGCTQPDAPNFDPEATLDDGSCCANDWHVVTADGEVTWTIIRTDGQGYFTGITGQALSGACLPEGCYTLYASAPSAFTLQLTNLDGNAVYTAEGEGALTTGFSIGNTVPGCMDPQACNYNPDANCSPDGACDYSSCSGCTQAGAVNYDPAATIDDGSCCFHTLSLSSSAPVSWHLYSLQSAAQGGELNGTTSICLPNGCFDLQVSPFAPGTSWTLEDEDGQVIASGTGADEWTGWISFSLGASIGCTDPVACNFDPGATCPDPNACTYDCYGCTNPEAVNFDPDATLDDGSCCTSGWISIQMDGPAWWSVDGANGVHYSGEYPSQDGFCGVEGCFLFYVYPLSEELVSCSLTDEEGNVLASFTPDDDLYGGVLVANGSIPGCTDPASCNYDPLATCGFYSSCDYSCYGCTDPDAPNYQPEATADDGSCCYENWYTLTLDQPGWWSVGAWETGSYASGWYPDQAGFCLDGGCFSFAAFSDSFSAVNYTITDPQGNLFASGSLDPWSNGVVLSGTSSEVGCTDPFACNYDPGASCSDYFLCDYSCQGCTDELAYNFDPGATVNNGTCCYSGWYTLSVSAPTYAFAGSENGSFQGGFATEGSPFGFCADASCFHVTLYTFETGGVEYSLTDAYGQTVAQGVANASGWYVAEVSLNGEVAGCMHPEACNFNPQATCESGSCQWYCGGCTDPQALNYNPEAYFEDGTCMYDTEIPNMGMVLIPDDMEDQFYVLASVMDTGNGAPYLLTNDFNADAIIVSDAGQYLTGPYPCDATVTLSMHSMATGIANYSSSGPLSSPCGGSVSAEELEAESDLLVWPNPTDGLITLSGLSPSGGELEVRDLSGRTVWSGNWTSGEREFRLELSLPSGIYLLQSRSSEGEAVVRIAME